MNREKVDQVARAVLYEGYILYPYRPSVKNRQRWSFGGIYPKAWSDAQEGTDAWTMQTQVLVAGSDAAKLQVSIRFLHLTDRVVGELHNAIPEIGAGEEPEFHLVDKLEVQGKCYQPWQEAVERELDLGEVDLARLLAEPRLKSFSFPHHRELESLRSSDGQVVGLLVREQQMIACDVELSASRVEDNLARVTVKILNRTPFEGTSRQNRDDALMRSLVSTHIILGASGGEFVSLTDPPEIWRRHASECRNVGAWPVMVGEENERDTMISSPIILSDYPEIAPESPGDLFDSTEIDEILSLRIMTLTDDEKRAGAATDPRVRELLARTDALAREQLQSLHGTLRGLRPVSEEHANG
jgi:hydrogenase maturation protease